MSLQELEKPKTRSFPPAHLPEPAEIKGCDRAQRHLMKAGGQEQPCVPMELSFQDEH